MQPKKVNWGIIGLGNIANSFAADLVKCTTANLYAIASRSKEKALQFQQQYNAKIVYNSYEDLAYDDYVDAIYIATPHPFHIHHTILCLQNSKAVLCEKPFAMNTNEVKQMISLAKQKNVLLMEAMWTIFLPHYQWLLKQVQEQNFGKLHKIEASFCVNTPFDGSSRIYNKKLGGGALLDIGIYPVFVALTTLGKPNNIKAKATFTATKVDESCDIIFEYHDATAVLACDLQNEKPHAAHLHFDDAEVILEHPFYAPTKVTVIKKEGRQTIDFSEDYNGYFFEIEHFNTLYFSHQKQSNIMSFEFSLLLINTLDEIRSQIGLSYQ
ncbi:Gfo/Idh/MocA family protein [Zhouia sp. PK063]|uniref:Gfo/Idh/MocA family protein n=1 Tax=Zhouia sp. PK063 TaxID=3373602 RepID=UPI00378E64FB